MSDKTDFDYSLMRKFEYSHYLFWIWNILKFQNSLIYWRNWSILNNNNWIEFIFIIKNYNMQCLYFIKNSINSIVIKGIKGKELKRNGTPSTWTNTHLSSSLWYFKVHYWITLYRLSHHRFDSIDSTLQAKKESLAEIILSFSFIWSSQYCFILVLKYLNIWFFFQKTTTNSLYNNFI